MPENLILPKINSSKFNDNYLITRLKLYENLPTHIKIVYILSFYFLLKSKLNLLFLSY